MSATTELTSSDKMADTIGRRFNVGSHHIADRGQVAGPAGLNIPLEWSYSHSLNELALRGNCWKVSGEMYITVLVEKESGAVTVALLDKNGWRSNPDNETNFISATSRGHAEKAFKTVEGYLTFFKDAILGVWVQNKTGEPWLRIAL